MLTEIKDRSECKYFNEIQKTSKSFFHVSLSHFKSTFSKCVSSVDNLSNTLTTFIETTVKLDEISYFDEIYSNSLCSGNEKSTSRNWTNIGDSCYHLAVDNLRQDEYLDYCRSHGAELIVLQDQSELNELKVYVEELPFAASDIFFLGGNVMYNRLQWSTGVSANFFGEISNYNGYIFEDPPIKSVFYSLKSGMNFYHSKSHKGTAICKKSMNSVVSRKRRDSDYLNFDYTLEIRHDEMSFTDAENFCESKQGHLWSPVSKSDFEYFMKLWVNIGSEKNTENLDKYWLGRSINSTGNVTYAGHSSCNHFFEKYVTQELEWHTEVSVFDSCAVVGWVNNKAWSKNCEEKFSVVCQIPKSSEDTCNSAPEMISSDLKKPVSCSVKNGSLTDSCSFSTAFDSGYLFHETSAISVTIDGDDCVNWDDSRIPNTGVPEYSHNFCFAGKDFESTDFAKSPFCYVEDVLDTRLVRPKECFVRDCEDDSQCFFESLENWNIASSVCESMYNGKMLFDSRNLTENEWNLAENENFTGCYYLNSLSENETFWVENTKQFYEIGASKCDLVIPTNIHIETVLTELISGFSVFIGYVHDSVMNEIFEYPEAEKGFSIDSLLYSNWLTTPALESNKFKPVKIGESGWIVENTALDKSQFACFSDDTTKLECRPDVECVLKGESASSYRGTIDVSKTGKTCAWWNDTFWAKDNEFSADIDENKNYRA